MEWILIGIAIAIGFYVAPLVITFVGIMIAALVAAVLGVFSYIGNIFNRRD